MAEIYTTKEIAYGHFGMKSYRIEMDVSSVFRPMQRHIWTRDDGSVDEEGWIDAISANEKDLLAHGYSRL